jgi:uncharacterized protein (DUF1778 family)
VSAAGGITPVVTDTPSLASADQGPQGRTLDVHARIASTKDRAIDYLAVPVVDPADSVAVQWPDKRRNGMATPTRARGERIEFRTTPEVRRLVERAVEASDSNLTDFAETSLLQAAQRVMAEREQFVLSEQAAAEWEAINARPARELPGLRRLMGRPSPFAE